MRFVDTIHGLNEVFETDIPKGSVVLVTGAAGTLKSGFTFQVLSNYLEEADEYGLYVTLEQGKENHLRNMQSMGIKLSRKLHISDFSDYRITYSDFPEDLLKLLEQNILDFRRNTENKCTCLVIDSLGALYSLIDIEAKELRKRMYRMVETFRREGLTTFIILEEDKYSGMNDSATGAEGYLADGIIELGLHFKGSVANRYMRIRKMRATAHSMEPWILTVSDHGLKVYKGNF
ncbi:RAD55 family ATPase [Methanolobus halotolerans]|uniref:Signal transduction protein n=1 Tax=Methanolobus halotolerans TaxID=2052935 RepID=A0A4E0PYY6_9EURY|nr:ATPase domain-containing protein [Methanolobus halotolerans]TGC10769.1 signal transduction protein [Methanolobus halotolerans]